MIKIKLTTLLTLLFGALITLNVFAGDDLRDYKTTPHGLKYKILKKGTSSKLVMEGYYVTCRWWLKTINDSLITSSDAFGTTPEFAVQKPKGSNDVFEGFFYLGKGDSATFLINVDSAYKGGPPPFAKKGDMLKYTVSILDVETPSEYTQKKRIMTRKQKEVDETLIKAYLLQNKLKATRTDSGIYYIVEEQGSTIRPHTGQKVTVNYTGMLLDGTKFDSNILSEFQHQQPFSFNIGMGQVIRGWDLGVSLFGIGGRGTIIIPSYLAYGSNGSGQVIKPNEVLVFDIELTDVK